MYDTAQLNELFTNADFKIYHVKIQPTECRVTLIGGCILLYIKKGGFIIIIKEGNVMFYPIGYVKSEAKEKVDHSWNEVISNIVIDEVNDIIELI